MRERERNLIRYLYTNTNCIFALIMVTNCILLCNFMEETVRGIGNR